MRELRNKTILLISPQSWGTMFVSKHHYAIELAKMENRVYFLNPPDNKNEKSKDRVRISSSGVENLWLINHRLWFPYNLKFHAIFLFHLFIKPHIKKILKEVSRPIDFVWSFDLGNLYPLRFFGVLPFKIFHPVDEPLNKTAIDSAKGCDIIFSVTREILEKYSWVKAPKYFINHGVAGDFITSVNSIRLSNRRVHIGFSGNLLRNDIDRSVLLQIVRENPEVFFDFFGSYTESHSNIGGIQDSEVDQFVSFLQGSQNVKLHGPVKHQTLACEFQRMDAFLICYDIKKDQSGGTNYHKIMEYLSTGKVIISNNVTTYKSEPDLLRMVESREDNKDLPTLFKDTIRQIGLFNSPSLQDKRVKFALENTYSRQVERIEKLI